MWRVPMLEELGSIGRLDDELRVRLELELDEGPMNCHLDLDLNSSITRDTLMFYKGEDRERYS
jgi:hypothetical protein